jgi:hypothetical protein
MLSGYNSFYADQHCESVYILPPAANAGAEDWHFYHSQKLLRLLPGDKGYTS